MSIKTILVISTLMFLLSALQPTTAHAQSVAPWWSFQSIDTMKYSRDTAAEKIQDPSFDATIEQQVSNIAQTGVTHVAIGTPYDEQFIPFLTRWVKAARAHHLKVWFRGNFNGWEGWFNTPKITRDQHKELLKYFIRNHADLFESGDAFSACPECENGGPGDPRITGDISGHRQFLIDENAIMHDEFQKIGKDVLFNMNSMNGDVARFVMDPATTAALGGVVVIDHYVPTTDKMISDIHEIAQSSQGKIIIGEFGAPIPDLHGAMTEAQQAAWIQDALTKLAHTPEVLGVNYWTNTGGSTEIWSSSGVPHQAVEAMKTAFIPQIVIQTVTDEVGNPIQGADVETTSRKTTTNSQGTFRLPYLEDEHTITVSANDYFSQSIQIGQVQRTPIVLEHIHPSMGIKIRLFFTSFLHMFSL